MALVHKNKRGCRLIINYREMELQIRVRNRIVKCYGSLKASVNFLFHDYDASGLGCKN